MIGRWRVPVVRLRATTTNLDQYDEPIPGGWTEEQMPGALFAPGRTTEPVQPGVAAVAYAPTLYWPDQHPDITPADRLVVEGVTYDVDGAPARWPSGTSVTLRATEGAGTWQE